MYKATAIYNSPWPSCEPEIAWAAHWQRDRRLFHFCFDLAVDFIAVIEI